MADDKAVIHRAEESAAEFGRQLRIKAMTEWRESNPKAAAARENSRRFGAAVPPLSGMVAVMAILVAKIMPINAIALVLAATALATVLGVLSMALSTDHFNKLITLPNAPQGWLIAIIDNKTLRAKLGGTA